MISIGDQRDFLGHSAQEHLVTNGQWSTDILRLITENKINVQNKLGNVSWVSPDRKTTLIIYDTHFEVDGWKVSKENLWKPQHSKMQINPKIYSNTDAQAWSKSIEWVIHWFYNHKWAKIEVALRKEYLPTHTELAAMFNSIPLNNADRAKILNIPLVGHLVEWRTQVNDHDMIAYLWSRLTYDELNAMYTIVNKNHKKISDSYGNRKRAFSVRTFLDGHNKFWNVN